MRASALFIFALLLQELCAQTCTSPFTQTDYGVFSTEGPGSQAFCTNTEEQQYNNNALQLSRHQAPPGHRLSLTIKSWATELDYDFATIYSAAANVTVAMYDNKCNLTGISDILLGKNSGSGPPSFGPYYSNYGAQLGMCFYSDNVVRDIGISYTLSLEVCAVGYYCPVDASTALPCSAGTYSKLAGVTAFSSCLFCSMGTYSTEGASSCASSCPAGTYASSPASCLPCAAGTYSNDGASTCTSCAMGAYSVAGAASCAYTCPPGFYSSAPSTCLSCSPGSYSFGNTSSCTACSAGTFNPRAGSTSLVACLPCEAGFYSLTVGAAGCNKCAAGTFNDVQGSSVCTSCTAGTYSLAGSPHCYYCEGGFFSNTTGASMCQPCPPHTYSLLGFSMCVPCVRGSGSIAGASQCVTCDEVVCAATLVDTFVSTIAGGPPGFGDGVGTAAHFSGLGGITLGADTDELFVYSNAELRMITISTGVVTTVTRGTPGNPTFGYDYLDIALGQMGIYVADESSVRLVHPKTRDVTMVGSPLNSQGWIQAIAVDSAGQIHILFGESPWVICILFLKEENDWCEPVAGQDYSFFSGQTNLYHDDWGTAARFSWPLGITFTSDGSLIIIEGSDQDFSRVRIMNASGFVSTLAGGDSMEILDGVGTAARFYELSAVAADLNGGVYVSDMSYVRHVNWQGLVTTITGDLLASWGYLDGVGAMAKFGYISGIVANTDGGFFVADYYAEYSEYSARVRQVGGAACLISNFAGSPNPGNIMGEDGRGSAAQFKSLLGMILNADGDLVVIDSHRIRIVKIPSADVSTLAGNEDSLWHADGVWQDGVGTAASFVSLSTGGLALNKSGEVFVIDRNSIRVITKSGAVTTLAGSPVLAGYVDGLGTQARFSNPTGIAVTKDSVFVADNIFHMRKVDVITGVATTLSYLSIPLFVISMPDESLRIFSKYPRSGIYNLTGEIVANIPGDRDPTSISVDTLGTLYVAISDRIATVTSSGLVRTLMSASGSKFAPDFISHDRRQLTDAWFPFSTAVSPNGHIYIAQNDNTIARFSCDNECPAGSYCPSQYRPTLCPKGRYGIHAGLISANCTGRCKGGTFCPEGSISPTTCPVGHYCPPESGAPIPCAPGFYSASTGRSLCLACPPGFLAPLYTSTACDVYCPIGTFRKAYGGFNESSCTPCPAGWYADTVGSAQCTSCDAGTASPIVGANSVSTCMVCPAGTAALAGSSSCTPCYAGSWASDGSMTCTECSLGTFSSSVGATSPVNCTPCIIGTTTLSLGAALVSQCIAVAITCPVGMQSASTATPYSIKDCTRLDCPPPLQFETGTASSSRFCVGCGAGTLGTSGNCTSCLQSELCPGLGSIPLFPFTSLLRLYSPTTSSAPRVLASLTTPASSVALAVAAACPPATILPPKTLSSSSSSVGVYTLLLTGAALLVGMSFFLLLSHYFRPAFLDILKKLDMFTIAHNFKAGEPMTPYSTRLGGFFSVWALGVLVAYSAFLIDQYRNNNVLVQQSLSVLDDLMWADLPSWTTSAPPWAASAPHSISGIQLRLLISGEPGACVAPLSWTASGQWADSWTLVSTPACGGEPVSQHVFSCAACTLDPKTAVSASFHYSCQSLLLEALSVPAYPVGATSVRAAALNKTVASSGARLASVAWTLGVSLTLLQDDTITPSFEAVGYLLSSQTLQVTAAQWGAQAGGGSLLLVQPAAASVQITVSLPLLTNVVTTHLTPLVSLFTLIANLVGLGGIVGIFGWFFSHTETYFFRPDKGFVQKTTVGGKGGGTGGVGGNVSGGVTIVAVVDTSGSGGNDSSSADPATTANVIYTDNL